MRPVKKPVKKPLAPGVYFCQVETMYSAWLRVWPFLKPYKSTLIFSLFLGFLLGQLSVILPALAQAIVAGFEKKSLIDIPTVQKAAKHLGITEQNWLLQLDHETLVFYVALCFPVYYFVFGIIRYFHHFLFKYIGEKVVSDIRIKLMDKFMNLDLLYFGKSEKGSGGLLSRTLNDTLLLQQGLQYYGDLVREPIIGAFLIVYMFYVNWQITVGCIVFLPVFLFVIRYVSKSLKKFGHQTQESLEDVTKTLKEGLDGVRIIQSFNLQEKVQEKFTHQVRDYLNKRKKIIKREELGSPLNEWFASILICGVCLFQAQLIWTGKSDVGSFIAFLVAAGMLDKPIKKTQQAIIRVQQNIVALERLGEVLDTNTEVIEPKSPKLFPAQWDTISFKDVNFSYQEMDVLKNINLEIKKGEVVALVGASGAGKSTLIGLLQRFFDPRSGAIAIGDTNIKDMTTEELRQNIGYVTQDVFLFDDSVENNIWFGDVKKDKSGVQKAAEMANAKDFILQNKDGFQTKVGERGSRFSGGEKQRISIARAVFKNPPILILDEATSALDSVSELEVQKGIKELLKGRTALVIAHRLSTIVNSDRIIVMKDGKIVESGNHQSLIDQGGEYAHVYSLQFET